MKYFCATLAISGLSLLANGAVFASEPINVNGEDAQYMTNYLVNLGATKEAVSGGFRIQVSNLTSLYENRTFFFFQTKFVDDLSASQATRKSTDVDLAGQFHSTLEKLGMESVCEGVDGAWISCKTQISSISCLRGGIIDNPRCTITP